MGGVGGSSAMMPICLILYRFRPHYAISHTAIFTFVSTSTMVIFDIIHGLKSKNKKKINYHIVLVSAPSLFMGTFIGVSLHHVSPEPLILFAMTMVLIFTAYNLFKKYEARRRNEIEEILSN